MGDHTKLWTFETADEVSGMLYQGTAGFLREELDGLEWLDPSVG